MSAKRGTGPDMLACNDNSGRNMNNSMRNTHKSSRRSLISRLLFPPYCVSCGNLLPYDATGGEAVLCNSCRGQFERAKLDICPVCGRPMLDCRCVAPVLADVGVGCVIRLAGYDPSMANGCINRIVNCNKTQCNRDCFDFLAAQLTPALRHEINDGALITFCPRSRRARRENGFDQAEQLAKCLAARTGSEFCRPLTRRRFTASKSQKTLGYSARVWNAGHAVVFDGSVDVSGRTVVLVDDVITTGATMSACASLLIGAGAAEVIGVCVAAVCRTAT